MSDKLEMSDELRARLELIRDAGLYCWGREGYVEERIIGALNNLIGDREADYNHWGAVGGLNEFASKLPEAEERARCEEEEHQIRCKARRYETFKKLQAEFGGAAIKAAVAPDPVSLGETP